MKTVLAFLVLFSAQAMAGSMFDDWVEYHIACNFDNYPGKKFIYTAWGDGTTTRENPPLLNEQIVGLEVEARGPIKIHNEATIVAVIEFANAEREVHISKIDGSATELTQTVSPFDGSRTVNSQGRGQCKVESLEPEEP